MLISSERLTTLDVRLFSISQDSSLCQGKIKTLSAPKADYRLSLSSSLLTPIPQGRRFDILLATQKSYLPRCRHNLEENHNLPEICFVCGDTL